MQRVSPSSSRWKNGEIVEEKLFYDQVSFLRQSESSSDRRERGRPINAHSA